MPETGIDVGDLAPRLAFFSVCQADFFEEMVKVRAPRRCYAKIMKQGFGAKNLQSMLLRFHHQTAAASLTKPQYMVNVMRTATHALAAVLGGALSSGSKKARSTSTLLTLPMRPLWANSRAKSR